LYRWLADGILGPRPDGFDLYIHPMAFAGWVGLLITSLNLIPIGQLDGGHILYALLRQKANQIATLLLFGAVAAVVVFGLWGWMLMLFLLMAMKPQHPPTANDDEPLGRGRTILGWLTLAFVVLGFTPNPFPPGF
jgi:membrane-associated protease RseP (regulator of RpoE activity)